MYVIVQIDVTKDVDECVVEVFGPYDENYEYMEQKILKFCGIDLKYNLPNQKYIIKSLDD